MRAVTVGASPMCWCWTAHGGQRLARCAEQAHPAFCSSERTGDMAGIPLDEPDRSSGSS